MAEMDLIPDDYRRDLGQRKTMRNFIAVCVLALCCIGLGKLLLTSLIWRENVQVVNLEQQQKVSELNKSKSEEYRQQMQVTEQQLAALDELRGRDRVALLLQAIDNTHDEGIWFDSVRFMRRNGTTGTLNAPNASGIIVVPSDAEAKAALQISQGAEIVGHAINHTVLAEFMRKLGTQSGVADLRLLQTGTRAYATTQVVDFSLTLEVNEKARAQP